MIILLSTTLIIDIIGFLYFFKHIRLISKEFDEIAEEQIRQNEDIRNLMIAYYQLSQAIKDAAMIQEAQRTKYKA